MPTLDDWHATRHRGKFAHGLDARAFLNKTPRRYRSSHSSQIAELHRSAFVLKKRNVYLLGMEDDHAAEPTAYWRYVREAPQRFEALAADWKDATRFSSSPEEIALHPSYQQIIGMGPRALPLILADLQREPDHWFWALNVIVGRDLAGQAETVDEAAASWIAWGVENRIIPDIEA